MSLVKLCRATLEANLLKAGERLVVVTPHIYDREYVSGMIDAAAEIGAEGAHIIPIPKMSGNTLVMGLTQWHWDLYASADLLITSLTGAYPFGNPNVPRPATNYMDKVGNHQYRTDFEYVHRVGSKTRFLEVFYPWQLHRQNFPTPERKESTLGGAKILQKTKEVRVTSEAGTDLTAKKVGRPGHAQYGLADAPGRWDTFAFGCVACGQEEYSTEGEVVLEPGDMMPDIKPDPFVSEPVKLTFEGGYITNIEGGMMAKRFSRLLASYSDKESYGTSHIGWGTHEKVTIGAGTSDDILAYHHNRIGTVLLAVGRNYGFGLGGPELSYSGMGMTTRKAKSHIHFTLFNADFYCDGEKVVERGKLLY